MAGVSEIFLFATPANLYTVLVRLDMSSAPTDPKTYPQRHAFELLWQRGYRAVLAKNTSITRKGIIIPVPDTHSDPLSSDPSFASFPPQSSATASAANPPLTPEQLATCIFSVDGDVSFLEVRQAAAIFGRMDQISLVKDRQFSHWCSMQVPYK